MKIKPLESTGIVERLVKVEVLLATNEKILNLSREALDRRLNGMNEFREALKDQQMLFVGRKEYDFTLADIRELRESRAELQGRASQSSVVWAYILSVLGIMLALSSVLIQLFRI